MLKGKLSTSSNQKLKDKSSNKEKQTKKRSSSVSSIKNHIHNVQADLSKSEQSSDNVADSVNNNKTPSSGEDSQHWNSLVCETVLLILSEDSGIHFEISGGANEGKFPLIGPFLAAPEDKGCNVQSLSVSGSVFQEGDVILEIQGLKVAGYTKTDIESKLKNALKNGNPVVIKTIPKGAITTDLRQYLNTRFPKGGIDHELQNTIRDNLYLRTVPVTTRPPRPEERNGIDYTFLSKEEFLALEKSGELLESGIYDGNHYGTPKPSKESSASSRSSEGLLNFPGAHPSSEGKRKRNRSNVEAMTAKHYQDDKDEVEPTNGNSPETPSGSTSTSKSSGPHGADSGHPDSPDDVADDRGDDPLGPLPSNWEKAYTEKGEVYFIDHNTGTSHWLDPRLSRVQKTRPEDCSDDELPFGWERIDDPHYGTYFIDHVNRRTQYENPVLVAKAANQSADAIMASGDHPREPPPQLEGPPGTFPRTKKSQLASFFTRDPNLLRGERIRCELVKSSKGLGFTIVGGDDNVEEFLQIKSVVPNGPAWQDGRLKTVFPPGI